MATAAIKPRAEVACKLCRGRAVKTKGQWLKEKKLLSLRQQNRYDYGKLFGFDKGSLLGSLV